MNIKKLKEEIKQELKKELKNELIKIIEDETKDIRTQLTLLINNLKLLKENESSSSDGDIDDFEHIINELPSNNS